jgi:threonine dehydrogenase-like Zn-dependent dehydrogenase
LKEASMSGTVKAAVLLEPWKLEIRTFPVPETGEDDGILRVEATGVCGSDWAAYAGGLGIYDLPCVLGHETVGRIERVGSRAARRWGVEEGDRVAVEEYLPCGTCESCLSGHYQMCVQTRYGGKSIHDAPSLWGGYSEYLYLHPQSLLHKISDNVPVELTQLFIPISNGLHWAQEVGGTKIGDNVVVLGPGPHGLGAVIGAREAGADKVVVVGLSKDIHRLAVAEELGADATLRLDEDDVQAAVEELTDGRLADVVINAASASSALANAIDLAGNRATVVHAGFGKDATTLVSDTIIKRLLTIKGVLGRPSSAVRPAIKIIESGRYPIERMCTHRFGIEETEEALKMIGSGGERFVRGVVMNA